MRRSSLILTTFLMACSGPSPSMRGAIRHEVQVGHSHFVVHQLGDKAEAVRTTFETPAQQRGVMERGHAAIEQATGCLIVRGSLDGDPAIMRAKLTCPPRATPN